MSSRQRDTLDIPSDEVSARTVNLARDIVTLCPTAIIKGPDTNRFLLVQHIVLGTGDQAGFLHPSDGQV